jgi:hypothetical protein
VGDQANTEFNSIFSTHVTMVRVDSSGNKIAIQPAGER